MPGTVKIGITDNLQRRIKDLDNTSTPLPFECYYAVEVPDAYTVEKLLHESFDDKRIRQNREFFSCNPEQAKSAQFCIYIQNLNSEKIGRLRCHTNRKFI